MFLLVSAAENKWKLSSLPKVACDLRLGSTCYGLSIGAGFFWSSARLLGLREVNSCDC